MLKQKLKEWGKTTFGELANRKNNLLNELAVHDHTQDIRDLSEEERIIRVTILVELEELSLNEESSQMKKYSDLWLKQGDETPDFSEDGNSP